MTEGTEDRPVGDDEQRAEREALGRIAHALRHYRLGAEWQVARWEYNLSMLSARHRALVPRLPEKIAASRQCIYRNHLFIRAMLAMFDEDEWVPPHLAPANAAADEIEAAAGTVVSPVDHDKVRYVLKNVARDWSAEGAAEREQSYGRILAELRRLLGEPAGAEGAPSVLVPGAGLARLCLEIVNLGYAAQGNEFSYFMLLTGAYLLNGVERELQWTIHPWVHNSCNQASIEDQLRGVQVPDVHPAMLVPRPGLLSMSAGDFVDVYARPESGASFDAIAACFFFDTAHNILQYLDICWHCLKPGGYLLHLGPLQYHWADAQSYLPGGEELSVELSLEEVREAAQQIGFTFLREEMVDAPFLANPRSMLQASTYHCAFWTLQKPEGASNEAAAAVSSENSRKVVGSDFNM